MSYSRILVTGDRNWTDRRIVDAVLDGLMDEVGGEITIIEGCARGADHFAHDFPLPDRQHEHYPADWARHGKPAGAIRNREMLLKGRPDVVVAFHDDLANSRGTKDMVNIAKKAGVPVYLVSHL